MKIPTQYHLRKIMILALKKIQKLKKKLTRSLEELLKEKKPKTDNRQKLRTKRFKKNWKKKLRINNWPKNNLRK